MELPPDPALLRDAIASGDPARALPAVVGLRHLPEAEAIPLLLLGLEQSTFLIRSISCAGLGVKRSEVGWSALVEALQHDDDANVRAEAANALVNHGVARAWPLLLAAFQADAHWLVRCSILSALAEQAEMGAESLLELARLAVADADGSVRVGGTEILGRIVREAAPDAAATKEPVAVARALLQTLLQDQDHRVVAAALNGLQT